MLSPQAKQHRKSVRELSVASVTDGVATNSKRKMSQASFAMRSIPTSSVKIKPRASYSYSGPSDGGMKRGSIAKPKRAMQLIQAPERKFSGKRMNPVTEVMPAMLSFNSLAMHTCDVAFGSSIDVFRGILNIS